MISSDPAHDPAIIRDFLEEFDRDTARRGRQYFRNGAVLALQRESPSQFIAVVRGSEDYEVSLTYDDGWDGDCSCPMGDFCKHIYAAMLALEAGRDRDSGRPAGPGSVQRSPTPRVLKPPAPPAEPASPLMARMVSVLGRNLNKQETGYLRSIQSLYQRFRSTSRAPSAMDLQPLCGWWNDYYSLAPLALWPEPPADDLEFWLYCAWEFRRRNLAIPTFMTAVTDFSSIEPRMRQWERRNEIARWQQLLAGQRLAPAPKPVSAPVDLRLVIGPDQMMVQWRPGPEQPFQALKQTHARRLMEEFEAGALALCPEAAPLWSAFYKPYDYHSWSNLDFGTPKHARVLNGLLRLSSLADRIVTGEGGPLARPPEPLRFELDPAHSDEGDYQIRLVRADGSPAPSVLLVLSGQPTLYLTANAVYAGPPWHALGDHPVLTIPAPAIESKGGVNLLTQLGLELPPRLAARTRKVSAKVNLFCDLKPIYVGSSQEAVFIRVVAEHENGATEKLTTVGWQPNRTSPPPKANPPPADPFIPILDCSALQHFPGLLEPIGAKWDAYQQTWRVKLSKTFPDVFIPWLAALPPNIEVHLDRDLATLRDTPVSGSVRLDVEEAGVDWFDLKVVLDVSDTELTPEELKILLNARGRYVRLGKKGWRRLQFNLSDDEDERLARLGLDAREFTAEPQRLHALQLADPAAAKLLPQQKVETIQRRAGELKARVNPALPGAICAELRPYQIEGFHFLAYLTANRFGGVLADDMGLGKTLQTLTWLAWLREQARPAQPSPLPSLVVCPKSVMDNWRAEAERFLPGLRVRLWRGEEADVLADARAQADLLVLNYAQLRSLSPDIARHEWHTAILDEAQYIKNPDSQTAQVARSLQAGHRLALTGTPIENRLLDLWSILAFAMPGVLGNRAHFTRRFNAQDDPLARRRLSARVRPFLLRRTKGQVAKDLPDRIEEDIFCELEAEQKTLYRAEFKRAQQLLLKVQTKQDLNAQRFNFLTSLLRLRQICCHPALVDATLKKAESAKVNALVDLLEPLMDEGHKVLVFSQFVTMLDLLRQTVKERQWPHFYLAGDTEDRGALVKNFQKAKGAAVFLISLKAGGFGLNLTAASYVVLFDPWWNPAVETQAIDRTHRIGQTSKVIAYRLLMKNSIEEKIRQLQKSKAALAEDVLGEETFAKSLTLEDLRFLFGEQ